MVRCHENDDLLLHGWAKFFYEIFLFVTFPFRKPIKFLLIVLFLLGILYIPVLMNIVEREELLDWYKEKTEPFISSVKDSFNQFKKEYFPQEDNTIKIKRRPKSTGHMKKKTSPAIGNYTKKYDKKAAEKRMSEYAGDEADKAYQFSLEEYENSAIRNTGRKNPYYGSVAKFNLTYPEELLEVSGKAEVINANELIVGGVPMFLFGVYTDPKSENYAYAAKYLAEETKDKTLRCEILAYSAQNLATAVCYIGVKSLNDSLVAIGMAKKVW